MRAWLCHPECFGDCFLTKCRAHLRAEEPGTLSAQRVKEGREPGSQAGLLGSGCSHTGAPWQPPGTHRPPGAIGIRTSQAGLCHRHLPAATQNLLPTRRFICTYSSHSGHHGSTVTGCISTRSPRPQTPYYPASQTHPETQAVQAPHGSSHHRLFPCNLAPPPPPCPITSCDFIFPFGI